VSQGVRAFTWLRTISATAISIAIGIVQSLAHRRDDAHALTVGDPAPDFTLPGSDGFPYQLAAFKGRAPVVIAWFPKAFTPGCTAECRSLGTRGEVLKQSGVKYFGANVDELETNRRFAQSLGIDYPILGDPGRTVARAYGVLGWTGYPRRWTFYVGVDGTILDVDKAVRPATHGQDVVDRLKALNVIPAS
jgi:peroxiredoxin Q/BCP